MSAVTEPQPTDEPEIRLRKEKPYIATTGLSVQEPAESRTTDTPPLVRMQGGLLIGLRSEAARLLRGLKILEVVERIEEETKGGIAGGELGARVSGTSTPKRPKHDRTDADLIRLRDDYTHHLRDAIKALRKCGDVERTVLIPKHIATADERAKTTDDPSCEVCSAVRPLQRKRVWRIRAGRCIPCYQYWIDHDRKADRPKEMWVR